MPEYHDIKGSRQEHHIFCWQFLSAFVFSALSDQLTDKVLTPTHSKWLVSVEMGPRSLAGGTL